MKSQDFVIPSAPPNYEAVDVVKEFSDRLENRKQAIRDFYGKQRGELEKQYQEHIRKLNKEEDAALAQLHLAYVQWVTVEPPDSNCNASSTHSNSNNIISWKWWWWST